jgi:hypothetical protein
MAMLYLDALVATIIRGTYNHTFFSVVFLLIAQFIWNPAPSSDADTGLEGCESDLHVKVVGTSGVRSSELEYCTCI